jgi:hypothetical protein
VSGANAAIVDVGTTSPLTITDVAGLTSLSFTPTPDTDSRLVNDSVTSDYSTLFLPQSPTNVAAGVESVFGLASGALTYISTTMDPATGQTYTPASPFNYAAIHQDSGEVILYFATAQTSLTLGGFDRTLSNINFYSAGAIPEPTTWAMMLLGFSGLGFAGLRRRAT